MRVCAHTVKVNKSKAKGKKLAGKIFGRDKPTRCPAECVRV